LTPIDHPRDARGICLRRFFVKADALASDLVTDGSARWREVITPGQSPRCAGRGQGVFFLDDPYQRVNLLRAVKNEVQFSSPGGVIKFEAAELLEYKPQLVGLLFVAPDVRDERRGH
jgi:hypothetical protein